MPGGPHIRGQVRQKIELKEELDGKKSWTALQMINK